MAPMQKLIDAPRHDVYDFIDPTKNLKGAAEGKTILITGAGTGIGACIAKSFALAGAAHLYIAARRTNLLEVTKKSIAEIAPRTQVHVVGDTDITNGDSVKLLFAALPGPPEVLVNNAGIAWQNEDIATSDPDEWWKDVQVNLFGAYRVTRAYMQQLAGKPGRIINVSSSASWRYLRGKSAYSASKAALNNFCEYVDNENDNIKCFAMHPGAVAATEMASQSGIPDWVRPFLIDTPALPGGTCVYLSLPRSDYLSGRYVPAPWDLEELEKMKDRIVDEDLLKTRVLGVAP